MNVVARPEPRTPDSAADEIRALAPRYGVTYQKTECDDLAEVYARLADAEADLDEPALLLIGLERAGHLSRSEATRLHGAHLRA